MSHPRRGLRLKMVSAVRCSFLFVFLCRAPQRYERTAQVSPEVTVATLDLKRNNKRRWRWTAFTSRRNSIMNWPVTCSLYRLLFSLLTISAILCDKFPKWAASLDIIFPTVFAVLHCLCLSVKPHWSR